MRWDLRDGLRRGQSGENLLSCQLTQGGSALFSLHVWKAPSLWEARQTWLQSSPLHFGDRFVGRSSDRSRDLLCADDYFLWADESMGDLAGASTEWPALGL